MKTFSEGRQKCLHVTSANVTPVHEVPRWSHILRPSDDVDLICDVNVNYCNECKNYF